MQANYFEDAFEATGDLFDHPFSEPLGMGSFLEPVDGPMSDLWAEALPDVHQFCPIGFETLRTHSQSDQGSTDREHETLLQPGFAGLDRFVRIDMNVSQNGDVSSAAPSQLLDAKIKPIGPSRQCMFPGCTVYYPATREDMNGHFMREHPCPQCGKNCSSLDELREHATRSGHLVFVCTIAGCSKGFSRHDSLARHCQKHMQHPERFPCPYCPKYRGSRGFIRKDHLAQHTRNYHHIGEDEAPSKGMSCPHQGCTDYRESKSLFSGFPDHAFKQRSAFRDHMRKAHLETPFQCPVAGCDRVGAKGWFRASDRRKHQLKEHADVAEDLEKLNMELDEGMPVYFRYL